MTGMAINEVEKALGAYDDAYPLIYGAMVSLMKEVGYVPKDQAAQGLRYKFRGIDDIMAVLQPALIKCGVVVVPEVLTHSMSEYQTTKGASMFRAVVSVRYTFHAGDGSHISCVVMGEGADNSDKAYNKAMAGAMKYAITQALSIPTTEPKDSEDPAHDAAGQGAPVGHNKYPQPTSGWSAAPSGFGSRGTDPFPEREGAEMRQQMEGKETGPSNIGTVGRIKAAKTKDDVKRVLAEEIMPMEANAERGKLINMAQDRISEIAKQ